MLASYCKTDDSPKCAKLLGTVTQSHEDIFISGNSNTSLLSAALANGGMDSCSFYSGPSDDDIYTFCEANGYFDYAGETCGSVASSYGSETCGSIAFSYGSETCGSIASSAGSFSGGCSSGGACSYSC